MKRYWLFAVWTVLLAAGCAHVPVQPVARKTGVVLNSRGQPVAGAMVQIYDASPMLFPLPREFKLRESSTTDEQGAFQFPGDNQVAAIVVQKKGLAPGWQTFPGSADERPNKIVLTKPSFIGGTVTDAHNQPVADAEVGVSMIASTTAAGEGRLASDMLTGSPARALFKAHTGPDGQFRIENVPTAAGANLTVNKKGWAMREPALDPIHQQWTQSRAGQNSMKMVMVPSGDISGKVLDGPNGKPVGGVKLALRKVHATFSFDDGREAVESAADGTFHFYDVAPEAYAITAKDGSGKLAFEETPVAISAKESTHSVSIVPTKTSRLSVKVIDGKTRKPVAGAGVSADKPGYRDSGTSDSRGYARLELPPGKYHLNAMKATWGLNQIEITVPPNHSVKSEIKITAPQFLSGTVFLPNGSPAPGVRMALYPTGWSGTSDEHGKFRLLWTSGGPFSIGDTFRLAARDWSNNLAGSTAIETNTTNIDIHLQTALTLSGKVTDESNKPIPNASLHLTATINGSSKSSGTTTDFDRDPSKTGRRGNFKYVTLPSGLSYSVSASADGYGTASTNFEASEIKSTDLKTSLKLKKADLTVSGRVEDTKGNPLVGAQLSIFGDNQPYRSIESDRNGHFNLEQLCAGPLYVIAAYQGSATNIPAKAGDTNVLIRLVPKKP